MTLSATVAKLFRALVRIDAIVEPTRLFTDAAEGAGNQRPDIFLRIIIDVAVTGVDGQSRASDEAAERPLQVRYDQKWLNTVTLQSKTIYVLFLQSSLVLVKFMTTSKPLLESRFDTS